MATSNRDGSRRRGDAQWTRRRFLRGVGTFVALPALPSLVPRRALASEAAGTMAADGPAIAPLRLAFVTFPNGCNLYQWWPTGEGATFELNQTMTSLSSVKRKIQVISGLDQVNAEAGPDGAGDHARANATLLTGVRARKTAGADIHLGISVDQVAAKHIGHLTRFPSLELTSDPERQSSGCDSGYACAYQYNVSWRSDNTPMTPEPNPRLVFERLFGAGPQGARGRAFVARQQAQRSILDFVLDDARRLRRQLGDRDDRKLDEYLTSVRAIEKRIEQAEVFGQVPDPAIDTPSGIPAEVGAHMDLLYDLLVLAFQTDSTRIATMMLGHDGDNRPYPQLGVADGHHNISHHREKPDLLEKIARIDRHHVEHFGRFLKKLDAARDVDGRSILDNSLIVYAGGNADPNRHSHTNLPVILAGTAGGRVPSGCFLKVPSQPMCNLYLDMLDTRSASRVLSGSVTRPAARWSADSARVPAWRGTTATATTTARTCPTPSADCGGATSCQNAFILIRSSRSRYRDCRQPDRDSMRIAIHDLKPTSPRSARRVRVQSRPDCE